MSSGTVIQAKQITMVRIDELRPNPKNRNKHPSEQIERLCKLIQNTGFRQPVVVSTRSGLVVSGHGRIEAARRLGMVEVPVVYQDFASDEDEYAFGVSDNAIAAWADLDLSGINADLADLGPDFDLDLLGIQGFVLEPAEKILSGDDTAPDPAAQAKAAKGDLYILGNHRLVCGDATDPHCWKMLEPGNQTMVFTSPPYGVGSSAALRSKGGDGPSSLYNQHDDDPAQWAQLMRDWTAMAIAHARVTIANVQMLANNKRNFVAWMSDYAPHLVDIVIWDKSYGPPQMQANVLTNAFEFMVILSDQQNATRTIPLADFHGDKTNMARVNAHRPAEFSKIHKATMPVELAEWAMDLCSKADHVIDPFGGTGTTMIAAERRGFRSGLIEMDPIYCGVIIDRWEKATGRQARLQLPDGSTVPWAEVSTGR